MDDSVRKSIENFDLPNPFRPRSVVDFIPNPFRPRSVVDFELCVGLDELREIIHNINISGYCFLGVTQDRETYTVFFRRPAA